MAAADNNAKQPGNHYDSSGARPAARNQRRWRFALIIAATIALPASYLLLGGGDSTTPSLDEASAAAHRSLVARYCVECHNRVERAGDLVLEGLDLARAEQHAETWEDVIRKVRVGMMPPAGARRPPEDERRAMIAWLEGKLDEAGRAGPDPGRALVRRLNRTEYQNAVRDLLDVEVDATELLPPDDSAYGFDNNAEALVTSPLLVEQYLNAAGVVAALAVGNPHTGAAAQVFRFRQDASQNVQVAGMPVGTVGGGMVRMTVPLDGEYRLEVGYFESNLGAMRGLEMPHDIEISVDGERVHLATIGGREDFTELMRNITEAAAAVEARSSTVVPLRAGPRDIGVGFVYRGAVQTSRRLQPFQRSSHDIIDVTGHPHIETLTVTGPFRPAGPGSTPSRERIFACHPGEGASAARLPDEAAERECGREILSVLARRAYRGDVTRHDVDNLMAFYERGAEQRGFEGGIQLAIERLLSSPKFTFRIERDPEAIEPDTAYPVPDRELATRLSFFLWSSIPDDELLDLAEQEKLGEPAVLEAQVMRMLADPKARALVDNFAAQWLHLRNIDNFIPNSVVFPNFDDNLRHGLLTETEMFFESIVREDRSILDLMTADYTFLNERVARHYGVRGVYGTHFRRVTLEDENRWGLLGKGSVLMVSSFPNRTSPVVRGEWVLNNVLGAPPPAPPADIPPLDEVDPDGVLSLRERLEAHRENPGCASCHTAMDPIGFVLENFDATGAWRDYEAGVDSAKINARDRLIDGTEIEGPIELREALLEDPEIFVTNVVEKLMIYALGRGLTASDMPVVRQIVRGSADADHRFSRIVLGVVESVPFRMRTTPPAAGRREP